MRVKKLLSASFVFLLGSCGPDIKTPLSIGREYISELQHSLDKAQDEHDYVAAARLQHRINHQTELLAAGENSIEIAHVERKYAILGEVLAQEIREFEESVQHDHYAPILPLKLFSGIRKLDNQDVYERPDFVGSYHPLVLQEEQRVFKDFGPLYVNITKEPVVLASTKKPWSGFWYPFGNNKSLYIGENSPLAKYDAVLRKKGIASRVAEVERERYEGFHPDSWEGLCDALAAASVMTPEPIKDKIVAGITFTPGDQKALLTFSHLKYPRTYYGISYRGNVETDGTYQDIKPGALHKIIMHVLGVEKQAFIIDNVAGIQVWNKAFSQARFEIKQNKDYDFIFDVKLRALLTKERSQETDVPTGMSDILAPIYTYRLYVDKSDKNQDGYRVIASQWTGDSYRDHPDNVSYLRQKGDIGSHNAEFNRNIDIFKSLFMNF